MTSIIVHHGNFNQALRDFGRKVEKAGLMRELMDRRSYLKPGERRRRKHFREVNRRIKLMKRRQGRSEHFTGNW